MKNPPIRLGPLALLLAVISICLTILAILTFTTARADRSLAEKYADTVAARYRLEAEGQRFLQELDRALKEGDAGFLASLEREEDGVLSKKLSLNDTDLDIALRLTGSEDYEIVRWRITKEWTEDLSIGNLWPGNG